MTALNICHGNDDEARRGYTIIKETHQGILHMHNNIGQYFTIPLKVANDDGIAQKVNPGVIVFKSIYLSIQSSYFYELLLFLDHCTSHNKTGVICLMM